VERALWPTSGFRDEPAEGVLRERLRLALAKATGTSTNSPVVALRDRSLSGCIRDARQRTPARGRTLPVGGKRILERRRGGDLFRYLLEKFASFSGISGVQQNSACAREAFAEMAYGTPPSQSYKGATHIVKMWEANEYPQLAANEYFCLNVAANTDSDVPLRWRRTAWSWSLTVPICAIGRELSRI